MKKLIAFLICLQIVRPAFAQSDSFSTKQLENEVKRSFQLAYAATVRIAVLDSAHQKAVGGCFSGVVVDAAGHILTAAHAVKPNIVYIITFPDGRQCKGKGLGVIHAMDAAMIEITEKGNWPFAKIGQFDRTAFKQSSAFDLRFGYERGLRETFRYANTQKNGAIKQKMELFLCQKNDERLKQLIIQKNNPRVSQKDTLTKSLNEDNSKRQVGLKTGREGIK